MTNRLSRLLTYAVFATMVSACAILASAFPVNAQNNLPPEVYNTPGPHVVVNGQLLRAPTKMQNGSLLLPMRAVFEALQAEVKWFPAAQQITATRGSTEVQLWINRSVAIVGGQEVRLAVPPTLFGGSTYVPLRFPAEAFGGDVKWNDALQTAIITIASGAATPAPAAAVPATGGAAATGTLLRVYTDAGRAILFQDAAGGDPAMLQVTGTAAITRGAAGGDLASAAFEDLAPGDTLKIARDDAGKVLSIAATYSQTQGKIATVVQNKLVLQDGTVFQIRPETRLLDAGGKTLTLADLVAGRDVVVKVVPGSDAAWAITTLAEATPPAPATPAPPVEITGVLTQAYNEAARSLSYQDSATNEMAVTALAPDATVQRGAVGADAQDAVFTDLQPGDQVKITRDDAGRAARVVATFALAQGKVAAIAQNKVLLQDGTFYQLRADVIVVDTDGKPVALADLGNGRDVSLKITPGADTVWQIVTPAAAAVAAPPPAAAGPAPEQPRILTVGAVDYTRPLKAGERLNILVIGTPGADAVLARIGRVADNIPLKEREPGKYVGRYTVGDNDNAARATISATMTIGGQVVARARSTDPISIDTVPPTITAVMPPDGAQVVDPNLTIGASFDDHDGSGVDPATVAMTMNGNDVTRRAQITERSISFQPRSLRAATYTVRVGLADRAGNPASAQWQFTVGGTAAGEARILAVTHDATGPVKAGNRINLTAQFAQPPARLEWYLGNKKISESTAHAAGANTYQATYTIAPDDPPGDATVSVRFFGADNKSQTQVAGAPVRIVAPKAFKLTAPADKSKAPGELTVTGEATPMTQVRVTVAYDGHMLVVPMQGNLSQVTVTVGPNGAWTTQPIDMNPPLVSVDSYTVKAELLARDGKTVRTLTVTLRP